MARIRTVKPEFFTNEKLSQLPTDTHLLAAALLCYADDEGYFLAHPGLVRAACMPLREDSRNPTVMLQELSKIGFLELHTTHEGKALGKISKFRNHQTINKPTASKIKPLWKLPEDSGSTPGGLPGGTGNREQGKEQGTGNREQGRKGVENPPPSLPVQTACEPPQGSPTSLDPEKHPPSRELANLVALATPFFRAKPNVTTHAVNASHRRKVYEAARWEIENHLTANPESPRPSLPDALEVLRRMVEQHQRTSPKEFESYRKKFEFYFADMPYHNVPESAKVVPFATKTERMMQGMNELRQDPDYYRKTYGVQ